jgi:iron complex outermembrane receptor protein
MLLPINVSVEMNNIRIVKRELGCTKTILAMCIAAASTQSIAQEQAKGRVIEEVIVTAQKRAQAISDVPLSIQALTADKLESERFESLADLKLISPSFTYSQGSAGNFSNSISMRGLGSFSFEGGVQPSVSTVVDGVALARTIEFSSDLGDIERIEVISGPQGTLFGRNSIGGALNIVRKGPSEEFAAEVEVAATDDDETITKAMVNGALSDSVQGRLNVFFKDRDGHIKNLHPSHGDVGGEESRGLMAKLNFDVNDDLSVLFSFDYVDTETGGSPLVTFGLDTLYPGAQARLVALGNGDAAKGQQVLDDPFTINANTEHFTDYVQRGFVADVTWQLNEQWQMKSISALRSSEQAFNQDIDSSPASMGNLDSTTATVAVGGSTFGMFGVYLDGTNLSPLGDSGIENEIEYFTQELRFEYQSAEMSVVTGVYLQDYQEDGVADVPLWIRAAPPLPTPIIQSDPYTNDYEQQSWAVFSDVTYDLSQTVQLFAGLRWTDEEATLKHKQRSYVARDFSCIDNVCDVDLTTAYVNRAFEFEKDGHSADWSGRVGAKWDVAENSNLYASYSRGFIGIGVNYTRSSTPDNAFLEPSIADSFEVGFKSDFLERTLQVHGAIFLMNVDDIQSTKRLPGSTQTAPVNVGKIRSQGLELNSSWLATDRLMLTLGLAYTDSEFKEFDMDCYVGQTAAQGCVNGEQDLSGERAPQAPELKYTVSANYELPLASLPFNGYGNVSYVWQSETAAELSLDPRLMQDEYGLLNVSFGIRDKKERYEVSVFGKNVTDKYYSLSRGQADPVGGYFQFTTRGAQAYWGIAAKYSF